MMDLHRRRSFPAIAMLVALLSLLAPVKAAVNCPMCAGGAHMTWPLAVLTSDGVTCAQMAARMGDSTGAVCQEKQYFWRTPCCGPNKPVDVRVAPTPSPVVPGVGSGAYGKCDICIGGGFPGNPAMVINMLYLNVGDCQQYYETGLQGNIPEHLCQALQFFAQGPCGCGSSSGGGGNAPPAPAPAPGGNSGGGQILTRKNPPESKEGLKLSNQRGGQGGRFAGGGRRGLKGRIRAKPIETEELVQVR